MHHHSSGQHPGHTTEQHPLAAVVFREEISADEDGHPAGDFAHRFEQGQAAIHLDRFISDAGCTRRNQALGERLFAARWR